MPASYYDLGPTQLLKATPDQTHRNAGNWTIEAGPQALNCKVAQAEIYQINIDGPIGSSFAVYRNTVRWNLVFQGWSNSYDPTQPLYVRPGDSIFLFWNAAVTTTPVPTAVFWLRYDTDLLANKYAGG
jgi:hypothetical protein